MSAIWESANWTRQFGIRETGNRQFGMLPPKHTYTRPEEADVTSLLNSICKFDFVVTIVIVQMCLAFKKGLSRSLDLD